MNTLGDRLVPGERRKEGKRKRPKLKFTLVIFLVAVLCFLAGFGLTVFNESNADSCASLSTESGVPYIPSGADDWESEPPPYVDVSIGVELDTDELVDKVAPAVVSIVTETVSYGWFLRPSPQTGAGTGVLISPDGYIVTNNHVVENAQKITVTLSDGRTFEPTSVDTDPQTDLAVVKIDAGDLPYLTFLSNSLGQLNELDQLVAVGNALALPGGPTWTAGVVSNLGRTIELEDGIVLYDLIQTDAAINPGNSGGPLVNTAGQLVGINVAIAAEAENVGFAISTNTAIPVLESLIAEGQVIRPWLGVSVFTVNPIIQYQYGLSVGKGALVAEVVAGSPAEKAGLKPNDIITGVEDKEINTSEDLLSAIQSSKAGNQVKITYFRGSEQKTTQATLVEAPAYS